MNNIVYQFVLEVKPESVFRANLVGLKCHEKAEDIRKYLKNKGVDEGDVKVGAVEEDDGRHYVTITWNHKDSWLQRILLDYKINGAVSKIFGIEHAFDAFNAEPIHSVSR